MTCCESCNSPVNVITRKKCSSCSRFHCARCLLTSPSTIPETSSPAARWAAKNFGISRRTCVKCAMLSAGDYTREDLLLRYSARELRAFLVGKHVVIDGCKEKEDLVDLAMRISQAPSCTYDNDREHSAHVAQMKEKMMSEMAARRVADSTFPSSNSAPYVQSSSEIRQRHVQNEVRSVPINEPVPITTPPPSSSQRVDSEASEQDSRPPEAVSDESETSSGNRSAMHNVSPPSDIRQPAAVDVASHSTPTRQRTSLEDIKSTDDIDALSVRQLKELLVNSFVDYKGCCERSELIDHVRRLWIEHQRNKKLVSAVPDEYGDISNEAYEENICKVCADAAIDCVLLECGHMVTCTTCGKRLTECPICRRYVTRVVHVFRA